MGLCAPYLDFIDQAIRNGLDYRAGLRMLELGDQVIDDDLIPEKTGKEYFVNRGYQHVSVDLNGRNGSIAKDLSKPRQFNVWHGDFDVVTNSGTTEHVEPLNAQYRCFSIIHDCLRLNGISIHVVPDANELDQRGAWADHCPFYYSTDFFEMLAAQCGYLIQSNTVINGLRCVSLLKARDIPFTKNEKAFANAISVRSTTNSYAWHTLLGKAKIVVRNLFA